MKNDTMIFISSAPIRSYSLNRVLLILVSFLFATTFLIFSTDSQRLVYSGRHQTSSSASSVVSNDRGRDGTSSNGSTLNTSCGNVTIDHGCYEIFQDSPPKFMLKRPSQRELLNCSKRVPSAIIIGTKKSGTTTLKNFLSYHPRIAFAEKELKFVNNNPLHSLDEYRAVMPYATPDQLPMEKTPGYFVRVITAKRLQRVMPKTKFIIILRNPVKRAISDYVHMRYVDGHREGGAKLIKVGLTTENNPHYVVLDSFADSVLYPNGSVKDFNSLIAYGTYVNYFRQWFAIFPRDQFLILDGEEFVLNPTPTINAVEDFLGVGNYFSEDHFYFDEQKHFYCLKKPVNTCMSVHKGRPHPDIPQDVLDKLTNYYRPFNRDLEVLLNRTFSWS